MQRNELCDFVLTIGPCATAGFNSSSCCQPFFDPTNSCRVDLGVHFFCYCDMLCSEMGDCCADTNNQLVKEHIQYCVPCEFIRTFARQYLCYMWCLVLEKLRFWQDPSVVRMSSLCCVLVLQKLWCLSHMILMQLQYCRVSCVQGLGKGWISPS